MTQHEPFPHFFAKDRQGGFAVLDLPLSSLKTGRGAPSPASTSHLLPSLSCFLPSFLPLLLPYSSFRPSVLPFASLHNGFIQLFPASTTTSSVDNDVQRRQRRPALTTTSSVDNDILIHFFQPRPASTTTTTTTSLHTLRKVGKT